MIDLFTERRAVFSDDRKYRYTLAIQWDKDKPKLNFLMLNPSTADEIKNDPTVERCERRARNLGYGSVSITNLFALRSTDPRALYDAEDPIGELNNIYILNEALVSAMVVCAWGVHGIFMERGETVLTMLRNLSIKPHCLKLSKSGTPCHPLYLPYTATPFEL